MDSTRKQARFAGFLYLLILLVGPIGLIYVPGRLIVPGDAAATAQHLAASASLLRLGIASELGGHVIYIFLVLALYRLFKPVDERQAVLLAVMSLLSIPIIFLNVLNEIAALILTSGAAFLSVFTKPQLDALSYLFLRLHGEAFDIAAIYWGLWLFPFGRLAIRSGFIPRVLGLLLFPAGAAYLAGSFTSLVTPQFGHLVDPVARILRIGEMPMIFWLLIWGAKVKPISPAPSPMEMPS